MSATSSPGALSLEGRRRGTPFAAAGVYGRSVSVPDRSLVQRREALAKANWVRSRRKELKLDLRSRRDDPARLFVDPPEWVLTMRVLDLLLAVPKVGRVKANRILSQARVSPSKTLGGLTDRQRRELWVLVARRVR